MVPSARSARGPGVVHVSVPPVRCGPAAASRLQAETGTNVPQKPTTSVGNADAETRIVRKRKARVKASLRSVGATRP
jgi:hypothetical protein